MPKYRYTGVGSGGQVKTGKIVAVNKAQAKAFLKKNGVTVTTIVQKREIDWAKLIHGDKVAVDDIILFTRLLSGALKNGMSIKEALEVLYRQVVNPRLKEVIMTVLSDIKSGMEFSRSISAFPKVFPPYYAPLVKAGEEIGDLPKVLDQISDYGEKIQDIYKEIKGMLTYPCVILGFGTLLVIVVLLKVIPTFEKVFEEMGADKLPGPTIVLQNISKFITGNFTAIMVVSAITAVSLYLFKRSRRGRYFFAWFFLKLPIVGPINNAMNMINFLKTLSTLINNGVNITLSLTIVQNSARNVIIRDIIQDMKKNVIRGFSLASPLHQNESIFPATVAYAVDMGERSGNLGEVLEKTASFFDKQVVYELKQMSGKVNPILTGFIGGMVLWVALAIYLPMFDMMSGVAG